MKLLPKSTAYLFFKKTFQLEMLGSPGASLQLCPCNNFMSTITLLRSRDLKHEKRESPK